MWQIKVQIVKYVLHDSQRSAFGDGFRGVFHLVYSAKLFLYLIIEIYVEYFIVC